MTVTTALENLIKSLDKFRDVDGVSKAITDSIEALGYDPLNPDQDYLVTLVLEISAKNPSEAVKQAVEMIDENQSEIWSFIVEDESGKKTEIGGWQVF